MPDQFSRVIAFLAVVMVCCLPGCISTRATSWPRPISWLAPFWWRRWRVWMWGEGW